MTNHRLLAGFLLCCGSGLAMSCGPNSEQNASRAERAPAAETAALTLPLETIVKPDLSACSKTPSARVETAAIDRARIIPATARRAFSTDRIARTLHGIWQGRITGDDKDLGVDYFWIMDTKNNEGLIVALRNGKQTVASPQEATNAPKITFLLCPHEGYLPAKDTPMVHEFVKVTDNLDDAPRILQTATTSLKLSQQRPSLSDLWKGLLAAQYFESMPAEAFAGALFKPLQIGHVANAVGPAAHALGWDAEYRGGGSTTIKYTTGLPMVGVEHGEFIGTSTGSGDYLVSSPGNGKIWKVEASQMVTRSSPAGGKQAAQESFPEICYDLAFDAVSIGPLVE